MAKASHKCQKNDYQDVMVRRAMEVGRRGLGERLGFPISHRLKIKLMPYGRSQVLGGPRHH